MAIDFKKKLASRTIAPKTDPIELYETLDRKKCCRPSSSSTKSSFIRMVHNASVRERSDYQAAYW